MDNLWNQDEANKCNDDLDLRVYTSQLLGKDRDLVLHGGGNTSVKINQQDLFGLNEEIIYIKGSGWDLETIQRAGFSPVKLNTLIKMATLDSLSDKDMVRDQKAAMIDPTAPNPSIEAILHAIIPFKFVDHTHSDAVVTISNTQNGESLIKEIYGEKVLIIPYIMPGFLLAKEVYNKTKNINFSDLEAIILLNHGVFTFSNSAKESYDKMIDIVQKAEDYIRSKIIDTTKEIEPTQIKLLEIAKLRKKVSTIAKRAMISYIDSSNNALIFANEHKAKYENEFCLTPEHSIRTKGKFCFIESDEDVAFERFSKNYQDYFKKFSTNHTMLDPAPRIIVSPHFGVISYAKNFKEASIIDDIQKHTVDAIQASQNFGKWKTLSENDLFDMEYWELEQAKLKSKKSNLPLEGKVALILGYENILNEICKNTLLPLGCEVQVNLNSNVLVQKYGGIDYLLLTDDIKICDDLLSYLKEGIKPLIISIGKEKREIKVDGVPTSHIIYKPAQKNMVHCFIQTLIEHPHSKILTIE